MNNRLVYLLILFVGIGVGYIWGKNSVHVSESSEGISSSVNQSETRISEKENQKYDNKKNTKDLKTREIPSKVYEVLDYIEKNKQAPDGYVGGRKFKNLERLLPKQTANGKRINYQEWDVNPIKQGKNRGTERLVTGDDETAYYTNDHYQSFQKIK